MKVPCQWLELTGHWSEKTTQKNYLGPGENQFFYYLWYFFYYRIRYDIFSEGNISTLDNVLGEFFSLSGENLRRSGFEHLNLFQS